MVKKLWYFLFGGCDHYWKIIQQGPLVEGKDQVGTYYYLQCEKCGDIKKKKLI